MSHLPQSSNLDLPLEVSLETTSRHALLLASPSSPSAVASLRSHARWLAFCSSMPTMLGECSVRWHSSPKSSTHTVADLAFQPIRRKQRTHLCRGPLLLRHVVARLGAAFSHRSQSSLAPTSAMSGWVTAPQRILTHCSAGASATAHAWSPWITSFVVSEADAARGAYSVSRARRMRSSSAQLRPLTPAPNPTPGLMPAM